MMLTAVILYFFYSLVLCIFLVQIILFVAPRYNLVDHPDGSLKTHTVSVPRLGGVAIVLSFFSAWYLFTWQYNLPNFSLFFSFPLILLGLTDDLYSLGAYTRLMLQFLFAFVAVYFLLSHVVKFLVLCLIAFFLVSLINSFNLTDVSDGLVGSTAATACVGLIVFYSLSKLFVFAFYYFLLLAPILAFLKFNWPRARIFLGDSGSYFLAIALFWPIMFVKWTSFFLLAFLAPLLVFAVPLAELGCLTVIRTRLGMNPMLGSRHHFSHYLQQKGYSPQQVNGFAIAGTSYAAALSVLFITQVLTFPLLFMLCCVGFACWVRKIYFA